MRVPKIIKCRLCGSKFDNPIHHGSQIATNTCSPCRHAMFSQKTLRRLDREKKNTIKQEIYNTTVKETKQTQPKVNKNEQQEQSSEQAKGYTTLYSFSQTRDT
mgnify:CR=1 FL=1